MSTFAPLVGNPNGDTTEDRSKRFAEPRIHNVVAKEIWADEQRATKDHEIHLDRSAGWMNLDVE